MKQLTHKFELIPVSQIKHQYEQIVTLIEDSKVLSIFAQNPITLEQSPEKTSSGIYYKLSFQGIVKDSKVNEFNKKHAIIRITLNDGTARYLGNKSDPLLITVTPQLNSFIVQTEFSTPKPIKF